MAMECRCSSSRFMHPNFGPINLFTLDGKKAGRGMPLSPSGDSSCCPLPELPAGARDRRGLPPLGILISRLADGSMLPCVSLMLTHMAKEDVAALLEREAELLREFD